VDGFGKLPRFVALVTPAFLVRKKARRMPRDLRPAGGRFGETFSNPAFTRPPLQVNFSAGLPSAGR
jgi:hypothetical protein